MLSFVELAYVPSYSSAEGVLVGRHIWISGLSRCHPVGIRVNLLFVIFTRWTGLHYYYFQMDSQNQLVACFLRFYVLKLKCISDVINRHWLSPPFINGVGISYMVKSQSNFSIGKLRKWIQWIIHCSGRFVNYSYAQMITSVPLPFKWNNCLKLYTQTHKSQEGAPWDREDDVIWKVLDSGWNLSRRQEELLRQEDLWWRSIEMREGGNKRWVHDL